MPSGALPPLPGAALAAAAAEEAARYPGPGPWDARAWAGAALYLALFAAALWGVWALCRGAPGAEGER